MITWAGRSLVAFSVATALVQTPSWGQTTEVVTSISSRYEPSGGRDSVSIAWQELADSFIEEHLEAATEEGLEATFEVALEHSFARLDLGAVRVYCPAGRWGDRKWHKELQSSLVGLCEMQVALAHWVHPGDEVALELAPHWERVLEWIDSWKASDFKRLERSEQRDLAQFLEPEEEVSAALQALQSAYAKGGSLGFSWRGKAERVELIVVPTRRDFIETVAFLGRSDTEFRRNNWVPGVEQWTQLWAGWRLVLACEYAPWGGFDPKFKQRKPISDIEKDGVAQLVVQQAAQAFLTIEGATPEPLFEKRGLANTLVIQARGALNVIDSERGMSTTGAKTEPYERFVPGGNPNGGTLPAIPAAPLDTVVESQWRKGHGEAYYSEELHDGQKAGAKLAKKKKHPRCKDKHCHFTLMSEDQQKFAVSAPFLGKHAKEQPYPPAEFLNDFREFFTAYQTSFTHWLRTSSDDDPEVCAKRFAAYLRAVTSVRDSETLHGRIESIYGLPLSSTDASVDSLEWRFLAWLAEQ